MQPYRGLGFVPPKYDLVPPFSGEKTTCVKCTNTMSTWNKWDSETDTLTRRCYSCSFTWAERGADKL